MNDKGFLLFIFFIIVFFVLLTGGSIVRYFKRAKLKAKKNAEAKAQKFRDETGRQQRQYHYTAQPTPNQQTKSRSVQEETPQQKEEEPVEIHTKTATGETIIDRRTERESKKIYEDAEGEYVEFSEE
ncbi:MAG: DUF4834 family protein [Prevotella sp.]|nr:DUF4834 family protein [Prevotella sp.]